MTKIILINRSNRVVTSFPYTFPINLTERNAIGAQVIVIGTTVNSVVSLTSMREPTRSFPYDFPINFSGGLAGTLTTQGNKVVIL